MDDNLWKEVCAGNEEVIRTEGILYATRYSTDRIEFGRDQVIEVLKSMGIRLVEILNMVGFVGSYDSAVIEPLAEELSVLNEASEFSVAGVRSIEDIKNKYMGAWFGFIDERKLANAYELVNIEIPSVVRGLRAADYHNKVLTAGERRDLEELMDFSRRKDDLMNRPGGFVVLRG